MENQVRIPCGTKFLQVCDCFIVGIVKDWFVLLDNNFFDLQISRVYLELQHFRLLLLKYRGNQQSQIICRDV